MFSFLILIPIFLFGFSVSFPSENDKLPILGVIGGSYATLGQFPYQVYLKAKKAHSCGGALIAPKIVLTAAHCTLNEPVFGMTVVAGTINRFFGGVEFRVNRYVEHPNYNKKTNENDLAVVFLGKAFKFGPTIQPIDLPNLGENIPEGGVATVSGWGIQSKEGDKSADLKYAYLPIWKKLECDRILKNVTKSPVYCGGDKSGDENACSGDSGGPLVYNNKIFGVVSFGFGCGKKNAPVIYTNVGGFIDWIAETIKD